VEDARLKFLELLPDITKLSEIEQVIYALAEEIKKTKRIVNALEYIKIPELEKLEKDIKAKLAEIEREGFIRLKNVKKQLE
jgi:V/A-type H+-transporting ATPase subunit D